MAFDFDGTLTSRDSFTAFLRWRFGARAYAAGMFALAPFAARYVLDRDRGRLKAAAVRRFLAGMPRTELEAWGPDLRQRRRPRPAPPRRPARLATLAERRGAAGDRHRQPRDPGRADRAGTGR
ncbi:MAG: haloacid dehalogenase-like hydrolase [Caulobacteraceae bacterium]